MKSSSQASFRLFVILCALFVTALVTCNLIANKFITIDLGIKTFVISAGVLPYPITFLITDILSEIYGKEKTQQVVISGFLASIFVIFMLWAGGLFPAIEASPVSNENYDTVFQNSWRIILASMAAYLTAQLIDVRIFHYWKKKTKGKHLWLRNNVSTISSQLVDTTLVVFVLFVGVLPFNTMIGYIIDGWLFKTICAAVDTPIAYAIIHTIRTKFSIKNYKDIDFLS